MIVEREMHFKVVGKDKQKGWFRTKYIVALRLDDMYALKRYRGAVKTIPVPFGTWCSFEVGEEYNITMYSSDNYNWFFHRRQANVEDD